MHKSAIIDHDSTESRSRPGGGQICRQRVGPENKRHQRRLRKTKDSMNRDEG